MQVASAVSVREHSNRLRPEVFAMRYQPLRFVRTPARTPKVGSAGVVGGVLALTCEVLPSHQCQIETSSDFSAKPSWGEDVFFLPAVVPPTKTVRPLVLPACLTE